MLAFKVKDEVAANITALVLAALIIKNIKCAINGLTLSFGGTWTPRLVQSVSKINN